MSRVTMADALHFVFIYAPVVIYLLLCFYLYSSAVPVILVQSILCAWKHLKASRDTFWPIQYEYIRNYHIHQLVLI